MTQNADSVRCASCHEPIQQGPREVDWVHVHSGDAECWTGDGSVAQPDQNDSSGASS